MNIKVSPYVWNCYHHYNGVKVTMLMAAGSSCAWKKPFHAHQKGNCIVSDKEFISMKREFKQKVISITPLAIQRRNDKKAP